MSHADKYMVQAEQSTIEAASAEMEKAAQNDPGLSMKLGIIACFFETLKHNAARDIIHNERMPEPVVLDEAARFGSVAKALDVANWESDSTIQSPSNPFHYMWRRFVNWANDNGLDAQIVEQEAQGQPHYELAIVAL